MARTPKSLAFVSRCLSNGLDTRKMDQFLDHMLTLGAEVGSVTCELVNDTTLRLRTQDAVLHEMKLSLAKGKLRSLCARLAVRCRDWANHEVCPLGDVAELESPVTKKTCTVHFENRNDAVSISVQDSSARHGARPMTASGAGANKQSVAVAKSRLRRALKGLGAAKP